MGDDIDMALAEEGARFCFAVVASESRLLSCYVLSKDRPIPVGALRHVDALRGILEKSILHDTDPTGTTRQ